MQLAQVKFANGPDFGVPAEGDSVTLLLAVQNKAIDVLVRGIEPYVKNDPANSQVTMLVIGTESNPNMGDAAAEYTLDHLVSQNTEYQKVLAEYDRLTMLSQTSDTRLKEAQAKEVELKEIKSLVIEKILRGVRIAFGTTSELFKLFGHPSLRAQLCPRITTVLADEVGTIPEYTMPVIACLPALRRAAFIGDTQQLPPFSHLSQYYGRRVFFPIVTVRVTHARAFNTRELPGTGAASASWRTKYGQGADASVSDGKANLQVCQ
eukprot:gnl/MRDRNA2_/MRDRNA2_46632_c0_seq2.p2 gnl/MRDRNA2_/MRDRNA2_46632_c0~~gnl/MRDRNA2_/MRDRNA2_46632_c0_seq2.p2  ORF type:complete len:287 (+),score=55.96 gnl/MRDRNA2_/MRDRNA2_46632_c0_seq2:70-861(+)